MKKSEILNALCFENSSLVKLIVKDEDLLLSLEGTFTPLQAMRMIKKLPSKFKYEYKPFE